MTELKNIFKIFYPKTLTFTSMNKSKNEINFVSSKATNNGVVDRVAIPKDVQIYKKGSITVPLKGSVLEASLQTEDFIIAHQTAVLYSSELTTQEKIYYICYIKKYKENYNYGRQADRTLKNLLVPEKHEIPNWVYEIEIPDYSDIVEPKENKIVELPDSSKWKEFLFSEVFNMERGRGTSAREAKDNPGQHPYIGASSQNNGITILTNNKPTHQGNSITISTDGSVGESFYQEKDFSSTSNIVVITLKNKKLNPFIALLLTTLIKQIGQSFDYGRKWGITRMKESKISLPVDSNGNPDWQLMEDYIKSLPYSKYL